ncbi:MAG: competence/damage-inducible protein A [Opitutales bacterium]|nr:competence/damage-inducible protein A [Opitutales bacterium]
MASRKKIELITIGEELLLGLRLNGHLSWIGEQIARRGLTLSRNTSVSDQPEDIEQSFTEAWQRADIVITTGGLGPTADDRTREVIAETLGRPLVRHLGWEKILEEYITNLGRKVLPSHRKQALIPEGAEILPNKNGTAPGLWVSAKGKILIMLPGPTQELQPMFRDEVVPRLEMLEILRCKDHFVEIRTAGVGESVVEQMVAPLGEKYPHLQIAYCAMDGVVDVRFSTANQEYGPDKLQAIADECRTILGDDFVGFGQPLLGQIINDTLREEGQTVAVAESCTGGFLANAFTDIPGSSKTFSGGVVCYNNDAKVQILGVPECLLKQHGAVSAETAVAMAAGAAEKFSSDFAASVTGFAGPGGGTLESPVGTIFIGLHTPQGIWSKKCNFPGTRVTVKKRAVNMALDWLRREVLRQQSDPPPEAIPPYLG